ncbi:catalase HPII [Salmonella enterica subsp. enterica]|uniref:catalase n=1 Tax=Salmonella enterica I TaxID=59201 RepID=A0A3S4JFS9_SALET|nr:catalase HPII [Salmonella enterica subsp. enterica]
MAIKSAKRSPSFGEYYSHPRLFWLSQTPIEQQHIIDAFSFELGKVAPRVYSGAGGRSVSAY